MKIVLIGPSGAGKGSLAEYLIRDYNIAHISTGDIFRKNMAEKTELGLRAEKYVTAGLFCPDDLVVEMLLARIKENDCANGFILDGFPRTLVQAELLTQNVKIDLAIELDSSDETVLTRLLGRYMCRKCGQIHNSRYDEIKKCKKCGSKQLYQRDDDKEEKIRRRLSEYRSYSAALLEYYRKRGMLISIKSGLENKPADIYAVFKKELGARK